MKHARILSLMFLLIGTLAYGQTANDAGPAAYERYLSLHRQYTEAVSRHATPEQIQRIHNDLQAARDEYYRLTGKAPVDETPTVELPPTHADVIAPTTPTTTAAAPTSPTAPASSTVLDSSFLDTLVPGLFGENRVRDADRLLTTLKDLLKNETDPGRQAAIQVEIANLMVEGKGDYAGAVTWLQQSTEGMTSQKHKLALYEALYYLKRDQRIAAQVAVVTKNETERQNHLARFKQTSWLAVPSKISSLSGYVWNSVTTWVARSKLKRLQQQEKDLQKGDFRKWLVLSPGEHYQQTELQFDDPIGDAFLMKKLDQMPVNLIKALLPGGHYPQAEADEKRQKDWIDANGNVIPFEIGKIVPIDVDRLINKMRDIMYRLPEIKPVIGEEHKWSSEAQKQMFTSYFARVGRLLRGREKYVPMPVMFQSKLFLLLGCGWTSRYAATGQEAALEAKVMAYPDRGVQIHDLFRESYILNKGNMYLTLLTAENVLAGNPYRVDRGEAPLQKKLAYLREDSLPRGDNYGAWYHFFGIGMYGLVRPALVVRAVAEIESMGSLFLEGKDKQEDYINRYGAIWGRKVEKMMREKTYLRPLRLDERTDYMLNNPNLQQPADQGIKKQLREGLQKSIKALKNIAR